ncbi:hypothetical protein K7395_22415 [Streptomyces filamentosus]|uniref:Secreted protein n=2 Tax=Streptomyces filamentosus TaxID=67294 RepID=A0ABY4V0T0_STRFL|nr:MULTISPECIES: hypothetical protein [Streptomyces]EFE75042.1 predicted protein [Streptomyces filamentosus NRRL 15998]ESU48356.1 hypothetical protein P376_3666 [Streptomyces sp. HCCB10043]EWS92107.1 hypothetical protein SSIG_02596 [Streptomyces filamentosus NRRL 11379]MYR79126.1 hypothetical protein [Streptomyces sp. SID5466]USC49278.1 hypothetical protein K7395_22415 [Streptomyces filamentosus]
MNKKYLVLPAALAAAAAVVAAVSLWPTELKKLREQNLCLGMLTEQTAGLIQDGKGGAVVVEESIPDSSGSATKAADPIFSTICFVSRKNADDKSSARLQYTLDVRPTDTLNDRPKGATPVKGGLTGWVDRRQSEIQLPDSCAKEMKRPDARYITVTLKISPVTLVGRDWDYTSLMKDSRTVILEAGENLTKQYDCAG